MPDNEFPKLRPHPAKAPFHGLLPAPFKMARSIEAEQHAQEARSDDLHTGADRHAPAFAELLTTSNYTFLSGASHPEELVEQAGALGHVAVAIADRHTLAGIVRSHVAAKQRDMKIAIGTRVMARLGSSVVDVALFAESRQGYANLCTLLTIGKRRAPKGQCFLSAHDVFEHHRGVLAVIVPATTACQDAQQTLGGYSEQVLLDERTIDVIRGFARVFDEDRLSIAMVRSYARDEARKLEQIEQLARHVGAPLLASTDAHAHTPDRRALQDVLTCIRLGVTIDDAGRRLEPNAERHLKAPAEMARLFARWPSALDRAASVACRASAGFNMGMLEYRYPSATVPSGMTPRAYLRQEVMKGAEQRYAGRTPICEARSADSTRLSVAASVAAFVPESVLTSIEHELALIADLQYETYFLTCYDIVRFARSRGIFCQGRGGAANSAVCYCLGITEVDPAQFDLLFERFISRSRGEPPDIDIDFEHERREEVIQYIYKTYGRDRAALTAEVISYRGRSAVRDVGKVIGLSLDAVDALAKHLDRWKGPVDEARVREAGFDPSDPTLVMVLELVRELVGFPRHLSQHVGGFVITEGPLCELVPIENAAMEDRTVIEWDKDDIDAMGMLKVDVLGLGMLTCVRKAIALVQGDEGGPSECSDTRIVSRYRDIVSDMTDVRVYDMICKADTVGVFQIESRAQMSMLPRLRPRCFYDLVIEVAIVRPGPIQGDMVHPYLRRRSGAEAFSFPNAAMERVLGRTLGVPLFQEQAMQLAIVAAGFSPDEADQLRRAMAAWKRKGDAIYRFGTKLVEGMLARGYPREFAERCFEQIKGFSEYGFPESHAASFALIVYASAWLKRHHPAEFAAALINSQPMGFYAPAQILRDAQEHGVKVWPIDVSFSSWECGTEHGTDQDAGPGIRLGLRLVRGLSEVDGQKLELAMRRRGRGRACASVTALWRESGVSVAGLRALARADGFGSMGLTRQASLWAIKPLRDERLELFEEEAGEGRAEEHGAEGMLEDATMFLPRVGLGREVLTDYYATGLSLKSHPMAFVRAELASRGVIECSCLRDVKRCPNGMNVRVAGVVLVRQRPSTASGVVFITLEDETGVANLVLWSTTFEQFRTPARLSAVLLASGRVQREGEVVHVHVQAVESLDGLMPSLESVSRDFH
jgi:error-prone DNA polymerase